MSYVVLPHAAMPTAQGYIFLGLLFALFLWFTLSLFCDTLGPKWIDEYKMWKWKRFRSKYILMWQVAIDECNRRTEEEDRRKWL
jgi:hypothetical protein